MRFLVYNVAYGTGGPRSDWHNVVSSARYLRSTKRHFQRLCDYIESVKPDLLGLVELDTGSYRHGFRCQAKKISEQFSFRQHAANKYGPTGLARLMPVLRSQGNALFYCCEETQGNRHYFDVGMKRLILEADMPNCHIFLVHLALSNKVRERQIRYLSDLIRRCDKPVIVAGDFNTFEGSDELRRLCEEHGLSNPNKQNIPTWPAWNPRLELDYILCSEAIKVSRCVVDTVGLSDHLPIYIDFEVT